MITCCHVAPQTLCMKNSKLLLICEGICCCHLQNVRALSTKCPQGDNSLSPSRWRSFLYLLAQCMVHMATVSTLILINVGMELI